MAGFSILQEASIPFNGSGTFTLAEAAFVPNTPISSSAMNSDLSDIATNGLSNVVTKDGQTTITGPFKGAPGSVGLPMYSFSADTDCGMYRIAANNLGISVNGAKVLDIATTGLGVTGTIAPTTTVTNADGTVSLPSYTFANDLDSGMYRIGANNLGVAVNGAKVLDISTTGLNVIGTVSANGTAFSPLAQAAGMVNGTIVESHTGNAATFAIKTLAGSDPSAGDPVFFAFRNATAATGNYTVIQATAALSLTISSGSTMGFTSAIAGRLWLAMFNDGGTLRLGAINCKSGSSVYPLGQTPIASATSEGGSGGADSAQVFYANAAITSKAYAVIGFASYETGLATTGSWDAAPTYLVLYNAATPLPGYEIQIQPTVKTDTATVAVTVGTFADITGLSASITMTSACNNAELRWNLSGGTATASTLVQIRPVRGSTAIGVGDAASNRIQAYQSLYLAAATAGQGIASGNFTDSTPGTGSVTYKLQWTGDRSENYFVNRGATDTDNTSTARCISQIVVREIMA